MEFNELHLATYLLEVREVVELMLARFSEIRKISARWVAIKESELHQLAASDAGVRLDADVWGATMSGRIDAQAQYFSSLEAFLAGWARLSLLLFPLDGKGPAADFRAERGRRVRDALAVKLDTVLADRSLRDSWMHFDERLDWAFVSGSFGERHRSFARVRPARSSAIRSPS